MKQLIGLIWGFALVVGFWGFSLYAVIWVIKHMWEAA